MARRFSFEDIDGKKPEVVRPVWVAWDSLSTRAACMRCGAREEVDEPEDFYREHEECLSLASFPGAASGVVLRTSESIFDPNGGQINLRPGPMPAIVEQDKRDKFILAYGSSYCQTAYSGDFLVLSGARATISMVSAIRMRVEPFDLIIPGGDGARVDVRYGDIDQYSGPYDTIKLYKGTLFRKRDHLLEPGVPYIIDITNTSLAPIDIRQTVLVLVVLDRMRDRY